MTRDSPLHAVVARGLILTQATWTACLQLFSPTSVAYRAAGDGILIDYINVFVLLLCALGWADLLWHDLMGKLLWPSFPAKWRHQVCIWLYILLAGAYGIRAFVAAGDQNFVIQVGLLYVIAAVWIMAEAVAIAMENRK